MANQVIFHFDSKWMNCAFTSLKVNDRDSMSMIICRGHIRVSSGPLQTFL